MKRGCFNARLPENWEFDIEKDAREILDKAIINFNLSKRSEFKILKVAQDKDDPVNIVGMRLDDAVEIGRAHV